MEKIYSRTSTIPSNPSNPRNKGSPFYTTCAISTSSLIKSGWSHYGIFWPSLEASFPAPSNPISDSFPYILSTCFCNTHLHPYLWRSLLICKRNWPLPLFCYTTSVQGIKRSLWGTKAQNWRCYIKRACEQAYNSKWFLCTFKYYWSLTFVLCLCLKLNTGLVKIMLTLMNYFK